MISTEIHVPSKVREMKLNSLCYKGELVGVNMTVLGKFFHYFKSYVLCTKTLKGKKHIKSLYRQIPLLLLLELQFSL